MLLRKLLIIIVVLVNSCYGFAQTQKSSIRISESSIGLITDTARYIIGTGFVFEKPNQVITCAHIAENEPVLFWPLRPFDTSYALRLKATHKAEDIVVLTCDDTISNAPLKRGAYEKASPGDPILYIGYNSEESNSTSAKLNIHHAAINVCGKVQSEGAIVDFLEFRGEGIPGYSGGPVLNSNGEVIGILSEAWTKKGLKRNAPEILMNRAFSIAVISNGE